jgi:hypothetical protein
MCMPRIATVQSGVKLSSLGRDQVEHQDDEQGDGSDSNLDVSAARRARRVRDTHEVKRADSVEAWELLEEELTGVYSLELGLTPHESRRRLPRQLGLELSEEERQRAREAIDTRASCGKSWGVYLRWDLVPGGMIQRRLACQKFCGLRACIRCDSERRKRQKRRMEGDWRLFLTLGHPGRNVSIQGAWTGLRRARDLLFKRLEAWAADPQEWRLRIWPHDARNAVEARKSSGRSRRRVSTLDYAWCLENHQSGYPHIHFCINACYINYEELKALWSRCIGQECKWCKGIVVWSKGGICHYLSEYVSKCSLTVDLCAVLYRQRLWGTSLEMEDAGSPRWWSDNTASSNEAALLVKHPEIIHETSNWKLDGAKEGSYAAWSRTWGCSVECAVQMAVAIPIGARAFQADVKRKSRPPPEWSMARTLLWNWYRWRLGIYLACGTSLTDYVKV